jgi:hypothetical protein
MPLDPSRAKVMPLLIRFGLGVEEQIGGCPEVRDLTPASVSFDTMTMGRHLWPEG